jgi:NADH:ubiquinone oxidoreductase subunit 6 (subunit J)
MRNSKGAAQLADECLSDAKGHPLNDDPSPIILAAVGVIILALIIYYGWRRWWAPVIAFLIGFTPLILNIIGYSIASLLACPVHEWYADCSGPFDISGLLTLMMAAALLTFFTWPFAVASIVLFAAALVRTVRRRLAR